MNKNFEMIKETKKELYDLQAKRDKIKNQYYDNLTNHKNFIDQINEIDQKIRLTNIKINILENNLYLDVHNKLMLIYKDLFKKYENKNIGEQRKKDITNYLSEQIKDICNYDDSISYYCKYYLYFYCDYDNLNDNQRLFTIKIDKLKYDFTYYLENDEIKSRFVIEYPKYVENVDEEAKRLLDLYNETLEKKEAITKELEKISNNLSDNFKRNLYTDEISKLRYTLSLHW